MADNILTKTRTHRQNASTTRTILETTDYDNGLRLKQMKHKLDAMARQTLSFNDYNVKNQLVTKWMGKTSVNYLQKVDYAYNSVGWLTGVNVPSPIQGYTLLSTLGNLPRVYSPNTSNANLDNNDLLSIDFRYDNPSASFAPSGTTVTPQYGGNISQVIWQVRGREKQAYTLTYDQINRLTAAKYADISSAGAVTGGRYDENLTYDIRGNIKTLQRWGLTSVAGAPSPTWGMIDNLTYNYGNSSYNPKNQLQSVTDNSGNLTKGFKTATNGSTYTYDNNGNMTADPNKAITNIAYNHLNLPTTITFTNSRSITFMYDAGGNKLRKTVVQNGVTQYTQDYVGGIEYRNGALEAIYHAEGRITTINSALRYEYALKDHLGNTRIMYCDKNGDGIITQSSVQESNEVTQENHYYPFGLSMEGTWVNTPSVSDSKYLYNGKELNDDFGLGLSDYGARFYDAAVGQWTTFDPLAEKMRKYSPYNYAFDNPMRFIDPDGRQGEDFVKRQDGSIYWDKNANSQSTTKQGETYLGKELTFNFNSYIDAKLWDGPMGSIPAGDKLTSTVKVTAQENANGELTDLTASKSVKVGETPVGKARDFYPGEGGSNNILNVNKSSSGINVNFEQHASVSPVEEFGMNVMGFKIVDVAQKLEINYDSKSNELSVSPYTNIFPSATLSVNSNPIMQYNQPSFVKTHNAVVDRVNTSAGGSTSSMPVLNTAYYPSKFYKR